MTPKLITPQQRARITGGCGSTNGIHPGRWAEDLLATHAPGLHWRGADLVVYMIRRFGWPNSGSDPYKDLCCWTLDIGLPGFYLLVKPYLGRADRAVGLHWGVRWTATGERRFLLDRAGAPARRQYHRDFAHYLRRVWWPTVGRHRYAIVAEIEDPPGCEPEPDIPDPILKLGGSIEDGKSYDWGIYPIEGAVARFLADEAEGKKRRRQRSRLSIGWANYIVQSLTYIWSDEAQQAKQAELGIDQNAPHWRRDGYRDRLREGERRWAEEGEGNDLRTAIHAAIYDLLFRPVYVRDLCLAGAGLAKDYPESTHDRFLESADDFEGTGYAADYYYLRHRRQS